jgi:hypothetical protein
VDALHLGGWSMQDLRVTGAMGANGGRWRAAGGFVEAPVGGGKVEEENECAVIFIRLVAASNSLL